MKISKTPKSRIDSVDFNNLVFGTNFSDHMLVCVFKDGAWQEPEIKPYGAVPMNYSLHALHYGQAAFEGLKAYKNSEGEVSIFRPEENWKRLNRSGERLLMPAVPREVFMDGLSALIELDKNWVPDDPENSLYIRPFLYSSSEFIAARPSEEYTFCILCSPVGPYYAGAVGVKIETEYSRAAGGGIGFTKAAGNYGGAFYPTAQAIKEGYNQVIWTDHKEHKYIEESGTMNLMLVIGDTLVTPPLTDRILAGITRNSVIELTKSWGWNVEERPISVEEVIENAKSGNLKEAFGVGTAAVVSPINRIGLNGTDYTIPTPEGGKGMEIKKGLSAIRKGEVEDSFNWMVKV
jgi:branched-chain amino acid aminotransferase